METLTITVNEKSVKGRNFLSFIKTLDFVKIDKKNEPVDWWDELTEDEIESIEIGLEQSRKGQLVPHEQVKQKVKNLIAKYEKGI